MRARRWLSKLLLRQGLVWEARVWTDAHERWLAAQHFEERDLAVACKGMPWPRSRVCAFAARRSTGRSERMPRESWAPVVGRFSCLCGVPTLTAFGFATEIGDRQRFDGRSTGAYLGLVLGESSSGPPWP